METSQLQSASCPPENNAEFPAEVSGDLPNGRETLLQDKKTPSMEFPSLKSPKWSVESTMGNSRGWQVFDCRLGCPLWAGSLLLLAIGMLVLSCRLCRLEERFMQCSQQLGWPPRLDDQGSHPSGLMGQGGMSDVAARWRRYRRNAGGAIDSDEDEAPVTAPTTGARSPPRYAHLIPFREDIKALRHGSHVQWWPGPDGNNDIFDIRSYGREMWVRQTGIYHVYLSFGLNGRLGYHTRMDGACRLKVNRDFQPPGSGNVTLMYVIRTQTGSGRMLYRHWSDSHKVYPFDTMYQAGVFRLERNDVITVQTTDDDRHCRYVYHSDKTYFGALLLG